MSSQTGLADLARFEAFSQQWRDTVMMEAAKWCDDPRAQELLTDSVLAEFRQKYAYSAPPSRLDYYFRAQVCLIYSMTGQNIGKLQAYLEEHSIPVEEPVTQPAVWAEIQTEPAQSVPQAQVSVSPPPPAQGAAPAAQPAQTAAPAAQPAQAAAPAVGAAKPSATPDTFYDPVRTTFWTPDSERCKHVVRELELPDDEEEERSAVISFINTILFLCTAASFGFCVYATGFFQYLLQ